MDDVPGASLVNALASTRQGNDTIFGWYARYLKAKEEGYDAINGTAGLLLEDDGRLAINDVVDQMLRQAPPLEFASYAPLKGLPDFLDLSISLVLGEHRERSKHWDSTSSQLQHLEVLVRSSWLQTISVNVGMRFSYVIDIGVLMLDS